MYDCADAAGLAYRRPCDATGYLADVDVQRVVWNHAFKHCMQLSDFGANSQSPSDCSLLLTEPPLNFTAIQEQTDEIVFEQFGFKSLCRAPSFRFAAYGQTTAQMPCATVVDCGFSKTYVIPVFQSGPSPLPKGTPSSRYTLAACLISFTMF